MEIDKNVKIIYVERKLWHRVFVNTCEMITWMTALAFNHYLLGGSGWVNATICFMFIMVAIAAPALAHRSFKKMTTDEAIKFFSAMRDDPRRN